MPENRQCEARNWPVPKLVTNDDQRETEKVRQGKCCSPERTDDEKDGNSDDAALSDASLSHCASGIEININDQDLNLVQFGRFIYYRIFYF